MTIDVTIIKADKKVTEFVPSKYVSLEIQRKKTMTVNLSRNPTLLRLGEVAY